MRPPQQLVPVELEAGEQVAVFLHYRPESTGGFGETGPAVVSFQLTAGRSYGDQGLATGIEVAAMRNRVPVVRALRRRWR